MRRAIVDADDENELEDEMPDLEEDQGTVESESEEEESQSASQSQSQRKRAHRTEDEYLPGSIVRVKLQNFVTYDAVEFRPGPRLNMIIGPNGTGKSTIVCAIALGLGWTPNVLGRAKDAASFVKQGTEESLIEIELQGMEGKRNLIITRRLKRQDNTTKWYLNGKAANAKEVKEAVDEFDIDVGNLCCFLPQDRVAEFAQMKPDQLLVQTQKAAGRAGMSEWHEKLKVQGKERIRLTKLISEECNNADHIEDRLNALQRDVERARERQEIQEMVEILSVLVLDSKAREKKGLYDQLRTEKKKQEEELAQIQRHLQPLENRLREFDTENNKMKAQFKKMSDELQKERSILQKGRDELETNGQKTVELVDSLDSLTKRDEEIRKHIKHLNMSIEDLKAKVRERPPSQDTSRIDQEMRNIRRDMENVRQEKGELEIENDGIRDNVRRLNGDHENVRAQLHRLDSVKERRLRVLEQADHDTFKAVLWLRENKHLFRGEIYEPVMLEISIRDQRMANAVETCISFASMKTFVCEIQEDYDLFGRMMETQRLRVNFCDRGNCRSMDQFDRPATQTELQGYGFESYVIDVIEGPDLILRYLCNDLNLHKVPVALHQQNVNIPDVQRSGKFQRYITGRNQHLINQSNYGSRNNSTVTRDLKIARIFNQSIDQEQKRRLDDRLLEIESKKNEINARVSAIAEQKDVLRAREADLRTQHQKLEQEKGNMLIASKNWEKNKHTLSLKEGELEKERSRPTIDHQKEKLNRQIDEISEKCADLIENVVAMLDNQITKRARLDAYRLQSLHHHERVQALKSLKDSKERLCNEAKESLKQIVEKLEKVKNDRREIFTELQSKADLASSNAREKIRHLKDQQESSDELQRKLNEEVAKLEMITRVDPDALETFEARRKELNMSRDKIAKYQANKNSLDKKIEKYENRWIPALEALVKDVDQKFSKAFAAVGNAGEVSILKDEDYEKWGIAIKVKFRDEEELQQLDAQRQSGGERSISTVTYLLSLTEMSRAPFSLVDEINQGMDQKYERQVHNHMVNVTCDNASAGQCFLITPKLLTNLNYHDRMRVLIINNGDWLPEKLSLQDYAKGMNLQGKKRRMNGSMNGMGRELSVL
ncbi:hypothetical protein L7F22_043641 [Adiantum nelumboides]|nr:hypothetical protein [Adiantum nelumboides]